MRHIIASTSAQALTVALALAGGVAGGSPASAIQRNSVATHTTISAPTDLPRGTVSRFGVQITVDEGYHDALSGMVKCTVQRVGSADHYGAKVFVGADGFVSIPQATIPAGTYTITCGYQPEHAWTVLKPSGDATSYTVFEP